MERQGGVEVRHPTQWWLACLAVCGVLIQEEEEGGGSNGGKGEEREFRPSEALFVRRGRRSVSRSHFWAAAAASHRCERRKGAPPPPPPPPPAASLSLSFLVHETKAKKREDGRTEAAEGAERRKRRAPQISPP